MEYWPCLAKCLARFLKIFFIEIQSPFIHLGSRPDPGAKAWEPELQSQVLGSTMAVLGKMRSQSLENLLHREKTPFVSLRPQPGPWASKSKTSDLSQTVAYSKIHAVFSDGLAQCGKQLFHAVASPFPGPMALKYGVFYISLSTDAHRIQPQISAMQLRRVDGVYLSGGI